MTHEEEICELKKQIIEYQDSINEFYQSAKVQSNLIKQVSNKIEEISEFAHIERWIPVTEKLPEISKTTFIPNDDQTSAYVLVTLNGCTYPSRKNRVLIGRYSYQTKKWIVTSNNYGKVIAWCPLPKPFEEVERC